MQSGHLRLLQGNFHDLLIDTFYFDIHLQSSHTFGSTGNFEIHVAKMIFITQNVRKHGKLVAFFNKTHSDTSHRRLQWYSSGHKPQ